MMTKFLLWEREKSERQKVLDALSEAIENIEKGMQTLRNALQEGKKILLFGNGGSSAEAQHFATELMVRYQRKRQAFPAIALGSESSYLTAVSNDLDFVFAFSRSVEALGNEGDVAVALSTSGYSQNVIEAVKKAKEKQMKVIALLGVAPSPIDIYANIAIHIPSTDTAIIQEMHLMVLHYWAKCLEW